uniref:Uncharacterized protein n=1 Tax=uncultured bacterium pBIO2079 TaxID=1478040 RepID=A0A075FAD5_9BACT|nr:hypothetical protein pBIO2079_04 [uncultured bacterium pBIO2079]
MFARNRQLYMQRDSPLPGGSGRPGRHMGLPLQKIIKISVNHRKSATLMATLGSICVPCGYVICGYFHINPYFVSNPWRNGTGAVPYT